MAIAPFPYTVQLAEEICDAIATSSKSIRKICEENPHFPCEQTIYKWCYKRPEFAEMFDRAKEAQQSVLIEHVVETSKDSSADMLRDHDGRLVSNTAKIQRDRLIADNAKWVAARLSPKFKEKKDITTTITSHEVALKDLE